MDLIDHLQVLAARAQQIEDSLTNEEATKMALIAPFIQALYRSGPSEQDQPKKKTPEELKQWLADLHKGLDEAKSKAESEWDPSQLKNEPIGNSWGKVEQPPKPKQGPRGGRYTEGVTKDGVPYRRYF